MAYLKLFWLGPPAIELDGHPLRLEMRKTLALLAYLSTSSQNPTRETLAAMFWPEYDQQHAQSNLRRSLSSLNKSLPSGLLETDRDRVGLRRPEWLVVDIEEFKEQLAYADRDPHLPAAACPDCVSAWEKAVSIYRGDFFEGFNLKDCPEFDEWQYFQRKSLQSDYARTLQKLVEFYQIQREWEKAIGCARSWLALDRLDEHAHRSLMRLYFLCGQKSTALRQYEECKEFLKQELDQPPESETRDLYNEICMKPSQESEHQPLLVDQKPTLTIATIPIIKTKIFIPKVPRLMVERERLIALLQHCLNIPLTVISAPPGFGKTTLLAEGASKTHMPIAWVGLDHGDNDPSRLISYIINAP